MRVRLSLDELVFSSGKLYVVSCAQLGVEAVSQKYHEGKRSILNVLVV